MSILICSPKYGGCGHVGKGTEWSRLNDPNINFIACPSCGDDHAFQLLKENFDDLTEDLSPKAKQKAKQSARTRMEEEK